MGGIISSCFPCCCDSKPTEEELRRWRELDEKRRQSAYKNNYRQAYRQQPRRYSHTNRIAATQPRTKRIAVSQSDTKRIPKVQPQRIIRRNVPGSHYLLPGNITANQIQILFEAEDISNYPRHRVPLVDLIKNFNFERLYSDELLAEDVSYIVTIPLDKRVFIRRFNQFKKAITDSPHFAGEQYQNMFCNPNILHITVAMLKIKSDLGVELVKRVLANEFNGIESFNFNLNLKKLSVWDDEDKENASTICIRIEHPELQRIANQISSALQSADVMKHANPDDPAREVKLHVTLMNAKRAQRLEGGFGTNLNAGPILDYYRSWSFPNVRVDDIQLNCSSINTKGGYYRSIFSLKEYRESNV